MRTYGTDELVQHAHALVACGEKALRDADRAPREEAVERPAQHHHQEPSERGEAEQLVQEGCCDRDFCSKGGMMSLVLISAFQKQKT